MAANLNGFDPILFLGLHLDPKAKRTVSDKLLDSLSQYLIIRTIEILPQDKMEAVQTQEELFNRAQQTIPNFDQKIKDFLGDFLRDYQKEAGVV